MQTSSKISALLKLGNLIRTDIDSELFRQKIEEAYYINGWFTPENTRFALLSIADKFLNEAAPEKWTSAYEISNSPKKTGLILAGNIPLVGFHDVLSVFMSGNHAHIKYSSKDKILIPFLLELLNKIDPDTAAYFITTDSMKDIDAMIATGSDNTARYFEYYFRKLPHLIRKNRNSVAILSGNESADDINRLASDIFTYFGLGCRNVSKLYVPEDFDPVHFLDQLPNPFQVQNHFKYSNNYVYNRTILLMKKEVFLDNGYMLLKEDAGIHPPLSVIFYERYNSVDSLTSILELLSDKIQIIVSGEKIAGFATVPFGYSHQPELWDYADGVDTMKFLTNL